MTVAVIAAHPDDEVLGCGATIARLSRDVEVRILILGEGHSSRFVARDDAPAEGFARLRSDAQRAADIVGAASIEFAGLPDNRFDSIALLDVIKPIEMWLSQVRPSVLYTHHPGDLNIDHSVTFRAAMTATRPMSGETVRDIYAFEVGSSTEWSFQRVSPVFRPNVFVDVTDVIERKVEAMRAYTSEARPFPHPRSPEGIRATAQRWGSVVGTAFAEAFELIRSLR
jgi:LmbE family N-acetylglucosaminyl deacetylase